MAITFDVGFRADTKELSAQLSTIQREIQNAFNAPASARGMSNEIAAAVKQAQILEQTLKKATTDKGTSFIQMNLELKKMNTSAEEMVATFVKAGPAFSGSLNTMLQSFATADRNLLSISAKIKEMGRVLTQSFKFTAAQEAIHFVTSEAQEAIHWVQKLDSQLNTIQIVSGKTAAEMEKVYDVVIQKSKELRVTAQDYAEASQIFYQQGLGDEEVARRSEITIQAAKAAGQSTADMADQLTAVWNTYQMQGDELQRAASVGAKMGAETAIEFKDIAEAMQISASAASQMGVSYDSLAAIIATVGETTKQSASVIGNAYKTIFSRFYNLKAAGEEGAVELGQISNNLKKLGVDIMDSSGELIKLDTVIQNVGNSWDTYTQKQKIAIAEQVGGTRQYGQFLALMENFDKYQKNLASANAETGAETLLEQYKTSLESIDSAMENASEAWSRAFANVFTSDAQVEFYHGLEKIGNVFENILDTAGGLSGIVTLLAAYFSRHLLTGLTRVRDVAKEFKANLNVDNQLKSAQEAIEKMRAAGMDVIKNQPLRVDPNASAAERRTQVASGMEDRTVEIGYLNTKLDMTEQVTQATIQLNNVMKEGSEQQQIQAQNLKEQLATQQQIVNSSIDALKTERDAAKQRENRFANEEKILKRQQANTRNGQQGARINERLNQVGEVKAMAELNKAASSGEKPVTLYKEKLEALIKSIKGTDEASRTLRATLTMAADGMDEATIDTDEFTTRVQMAADAMQAYADAQEDAGNGTFAAQVQAEADASARAAESISNLNLAQSRTESLSSQVKELFKQTGISMQGLGDSAMIAVSSLTMAGTAMSNIITSFQEGEATFSGVASQLMILAPALAQFAKGSGTVISASLQMTAAIFGNAAAMKSEEVAAILDKIAKEGLSAANLKAIATNTALKMSMIELTAIIAAVAAVIALLVAAWKEMKNQSPEHQLDLAKEAAAGLEEEANAAKEAADNLRASFEKYDSAVEKLQSCTRGTEEWKNALEEVNDAALGIINTMGDMSAEDIEGLYSRNADGMIEFDKDKMSELQDKADQKASTAEYAASMGQVRAAQAANDVKLNNIGNAVFNEQHRNGGGNDSQDSSTIQKIIKENLKDLSDLTETEFAAKLKELGVTTSRLSDGAMKDLQTQVNALADSTEAADAKMKLIAQLKTDEVLGDDYNAAEKTIASNMMATEQQKIYDELYAKYTGDNISKASGANNAIAKEMLEEYNKATGNNWSLDRNAVRGSDSNRTFAFLDEQGQLREFTAKQVATTIAAAKALENLSGNAEKAAEVIGNLNNAEDGEALKGFITDGNFNKMTQGELEEISGKSDADLSTYLKEQFGTENLQEVAETLGYDTTEALLAGIREGIATSKGALEEVGNNLGKRAKEVFEKIQEAGTLDDFTIDEQQQVAGLIEQAFNNGGTKGAEALGKIIEATGEQSSEFLDEIALVDWATVSPEQLQKQLEDAGIATDGFADALPNLIQLLRQAGEVTQESAAALYNSIAEYRNSETGDVLDAEAITALEQAGIETSQYFQQMADGTYVLTKNAEEFNAVVEKTSLQGYQELIHQTNENIKALEGAKAYVDASGADGLSDLESSAYKDSRRGGQMDYQKASAQYALLDSTGNLTDQQRAEWGEGITNNNLSASEARELADAFEKANISAEQINSALEEQSALLKETQDIIFNTQQLNEAEAAGLDSGEVLEYAEHLQEVANSSDLVVDNISEMDATMAAVDIKKMNKGIEELAEGFEDWSDILKKSDKSSAEYGEALNGMREALSKVIDVEENYISDSFVQEHMDEIAKAAEGDAAAIDSLRAAMANEIVLNVGADTGIAEEQLLNLSNNVLSQIPDDLQIGATLDDSQFLEAANRLIAESGMTAEEAQDYFNSIGYEPTFETETQTVTHQVPLEAKETTYSVGVNWKTLGSLPEFLGGGTISVPYPTIKSTTRNLTEYDTVTEDIEVPALSADGHPKIKSIKKTSSGATNNYSKTNPGGTPPSSSGSKGGGGSSPKHSAKNAAKYDKIADRYGSIQSSIDKTSRAMDRYGSAQDSAFGAAKMRNIKKISQELIKQAHNYNELYKQAKKYYGDKNSGDYADMLKEQQEAAKALGISLVDITTNTDGFISNRTEIIAQLDERLEAAYNAYKAEADAFDKAKSTDEAWSERIDKLKENYENLKEEVDEYIESMDQVDETAQKMAEAMEEAVQAIRDHFSNLVAQSNLKLELRLAIDETDIRMAEFLIETLGDVGVRTGEAWSLLNDNLKSSQKSLAGMVKNTEEMFGILDQIKSGQNVDGDKFSAMFGEEAWKKYIMGDGVIPQEVMDQLGEMADSMVDNLQTQFDTGAKMIDQYIQILEMTMDEFDKIATKIEQQNETLDMYMELLDFSGKDHTAAGRKAVKDITDARMSNAAVEVERAKAQLDTAKLAAEQAQGQLDDFFSKYGTDESSWTESQTWMYNQLKDNVNDAEDILNDAQSTFTGSIQDLASAASEAIEQMAQVIKEQTAESLGGLFADFESMTEMYDTEYELSHFFLEDYDKAYQLNTLLGEINDQMEDITDPARLGEYNALLEETNALNQEGVNATQNDIELLKAKFEIQKAQDAYEEAKAAQNTMRLARDASGNWNYVYSSEQTQTEDAVQKLADAQYNYDKLLHEIRDESSQLWMQAQQEFFEWQETIDWARYNSNETYRQQIDTQYEQYRQKTQLYSEQVIKYNNLLGENFAETALGIATQYDSMEAAQFEYTNTHAQYNEDLKQNQESFEAKVEEVCNNVGIDYQNLASEVGEKTLEMQQSNNNLSANITTLKNKAASDLTAMNNQISSWKNRFISDMDAAIRKVRELIAEIQRLRETQLEESSVTGYDKNTDYTDYLHTDYAAFKAAGGKDDMATWLDKYHKTDVLERINAGDDRGIYAGVSYEEAKQIIVDAFKEGAEYINGNQYNYGEGESGKTLNDWDTILATGQRADGGLVDKPGFYQLAEDGEPEYVLNPEDTKNILAAVRLAQQQVKYQLDIKQYADLLNQTQKSSEASLWAQIQPETTTTPVAQDVKIEATFPNVSVASEIEEAFNNLVNQAVQYVGKANKK